MSAVHVPHCPHCHSEAQAQQPLALGWWIGQDCRVCRKRFDLKHRHDQLWDVRSAEPNGKASVTCPHCQFVPLRVHAPEAIPRDAWRRFTCVGCGGAFEVRRLADLLFDSRAVAAVAAGGGEAL